MKNLLPILIIVMVLLAGCSEKKEPITRLIVDGVEYVFSEDVFESLKIPVYSPPNITQAMNASHIYITFNDTNSTENSYFTVAAYNIVFKLTRQRLWELREVNFTVVPLKNLTANMTPVLMLVGPSEANTTSVVGFDNLTIVRGTSFKNMTMAADRLSLLLMGVVSKNQINI
jgi:hypothetical protein